MQKLPQKNLSYARFNRHRHADKCSLSSPLLKDGEHVAGSGSPVKWNGQLQHLNCSLTPLDQLASANRRVRKASAAQIARIKAGITEFGVCLPILVTKGLLIVNGHLVVEAMRQLGQTRIPTICINGLSEVAVRRLRISINAIEDHGEFDQDALRLELGELLLEVPELVIPGMEAEVIDAIIHPTDNVSSEEPAPPEPPKAPVSRLGDQWRLGSHIQACGDSLDPLVIAVLMGKSRARCIVTDPPYNCAIKGYVTKKDHSEFAMASGEMSRSEFARFLRGAFSAFQAHLIDGALIYSFMDWRQAAILQSAAEAEGLELIQLAVWAKTNAGLGSFYRSGHELCLIFRSGPGPHLNNVQLGKNGRNRSNVWIFPGVSSLHSEAREAHKDHPTPKPTAMLKEIILDCSRRGEAVLDPFAGGGATLMAAHDTGRLYRGVEIDPGYVDVIVQRWCDATGQEAVLVETGEAFAQVAARRLGDVAAPKPRPRIRLVGRSQTGRAQ